MKNVKKFVLSFALILMVALCPVILAACGGCNKANPEGLKIQKAMNSAITVVNSYVEEEDDENDENAIALTALDMVEIQGDVFDALYLLDYMAAVAGSSKFDYPSVPFKSTISVTADGQTMNMDIFHRFEIDGNNVSVEVYFETDGFIDYEWMIIDYNFETNTLNSFTWYSYAYSPEDEEYEVDNQLCYYEYADNEMKVLNDKSAEYETMKTATQAKAEELHTSTELSSKTYNFSKEYVDVYNAYNPEYPIQTA